MNAPIHIRLFHPNIVGEDELQAVLSGDVPINAPHQSKNKAGHKFFCDL